MLKILSYCLAFVCVQSLAGQTTVTEGKLFRIAKTKFKTTDFIIENVIEKDKQYFVSAWTQSYNKKNRMYESELGLFIQLDESMNFVKSVTLPNTYNDMPVKHEHILDAGDHFIYIFSQVDPNAKTIHFYRMVIRNDALSTEVTPITSFSNYNLSFKHLLFFILSPQENLVLIEHGVKAQGGNTYDLNGAVFDSRSGAVTTYQVKNIEPELAESRPVFNQEGRIFKVSIPKRKDRTLDALSNDVLLNKTHVEMYLQDTNFHLLFINPFEHMNTEVLINQTHATVDLKYALDGEGRLHCAHTSTITGRADYRLLRTYTFDAFGGQKTDSSSFEFSIAPILSKEVEVPAKLQINYLLTRMAETNNNRFIYFVERKTEKYETIQTSVTDPSRISGYSPMTAYRPVYLYGPCITLYLVDKETTITQVKVDYETQFNYDYKTGFNLCTISPFTRALLTNQKYFKINTQNILDPQLLKTNDIPVFTPFDKNAQVHLFRGKSLQLFMAYEGKDIRFTLYKFQ